VEVVGEGGGKRDFAEGETTEQSQEVICYQSFTFLALKSKAKSHRAVERKFPPLGQYSKVKQVLRYAQDDIFAGTQIKAISALVYSSRKVRGSADPSFRSG
jgi:hypothetical protein